MSEEQTDYAAIAERLKEATGGTAFPDETLDGVHLVMDRLGALVRGTGHVDKTLSESESAAIADALNAFPGVVKRMQRLEAVVDCVSKVLDDSDEVAGPAMKELDGLLNALAEYDGKRKANL